MPRGIQKGFSLLFASILFCSILYFLCCNNSDFSKIICIDPGHQARANVSMEPNGPSSLYTREKVKEAAKGVISRIPEYKITLAISLKLKKLLEKKGLKVIMTKETNEVDISNRERAEIANRVNADLFVRIHADTGTNSYIKGVSVLYPERNQWTEKIYIESKKAAQLVLDELVVTTGAKKNGIIPRVDLTGFNWSKVPVILVEIRYLTNPRDDELHNTDENQWKVARGVYNGILRFLLNKSLLSYLKHEFTFYCGDRV